MNDASANPNRRSAAAAGEVDAQVRIVATEFLRLRPIIVGPFLGFAILTLFAFGPLKAQAVLFTCVGAVFLSFFLYERRSYRERAVDSRTLLRSLLLTIGGIAIGCTATGAMASPLLPMLFAPVGIGFAAFGRQKESALIFAALLSVVVILLVATPFVELLVLPTIARHVVFVVAVIDATLLLRAGVASLAEAHRRAAHVVASAGEEMIRAAHSRTQSLEALGARVAHEVKNPLAAVRAIVDVMHEGASDDAKSKKRLSVAAAEITRIEQIIDGYGSLHHPLDVIQRQETDVGALIQSLLDVLDARATRASITLRSDVDENAQTFNLDHDRVKEAMLNLLLNALAATPPNHRVDVRARIEAGEDGGALLISVIDSGEGMDAATLSKIGTPFFTQRRGEGGTGLGVALVRQVAHQHGGTLTYESKRGQGTKATLRIPPPATKTE